MLSYTKILTKGVASYWLKKMCRLFLYLEFAKEPDNSPPEFIKILEGYYDTNLAFFGYSLVFY